MAYEPKRNTTRLNLRHQDMVRAKIRATMLIVRLQAFALGRKIGGKEVLMSDTQVRAAFGLLGKILPDLHRTEIAGDADQPVTVVHAQATRLAAEALRQIESPVDAAVEYQQLMGLTEPSGDTPTVQ